MNLEPRRVAAKRQPHDL